MRSLGDRKPAPTPVRTLAILAFVGGISCEAAAAFPSSPDAPIELMRWGGAIAIFGSIVLWRAGERVRPWMLQAGVAAITAATSALILNTPTDFGMIVTACTYLWLGVYAGFFFSRTAARAQMALIAVSFGAAVYFNEVWVPVAAWVFMTASLLIAGETVGRQSARLRHEAHTDSLTGALNRHGLALATERSFALADRTGIPLTVALIDLDDFKLINDREGHPAGDRLLVELTRIWKAELDPTDIFARVGGDEFLAIMVGVSAEESARQFARLKELSPTSWSSGVITRRRGEDLSTCLLRVDDALYESKHARTSRLGFAIRTPEAARA